MKLQDIIKINRSLIWYFWGTWVFGIVLEILLKAPASFIWMLSVGGFVIFGIIHTMVLANVIPYVIPYIITTAAYILCAMMIFENIHITTISLFFYGLAMVSFYQSWKPVLLAYIYSLSLTIYFFTMFPNNFNGFDMQHYITFIGILTIAAGCITVQSLISRKQRRAIEVSHQQVEIELEKNTSLAHHMVENFDSTLEFSTRLNMDIVGFKGAIDESYQDFKRIKNGSAEQLNLFNEMKESIQKNKENIGISQKLADDLDSSFQEGIVDMTDLSKQNEELYEFMSDFRLLNKELVELINEMYDSHDDIQRILSIIVKLTEKTKLLSLNTSIEAARGGNDNKGFTVIAEEIKKLSDSNRAALSEIEEIIEESLVRIEKVKEKEDNSIKQVDVNLEKVKKIVETIEQLMENTSNNRTIVERMNRSFETVKENQILIKNQLDFSDTSVNKNIGLIEKASEKLNEQKENMNAMIKNSEQLVEKQKKALQNA